MINCYNNGYSVDYYIEHFIDNLELKTELELELCANNCLDEIYNRFMQNKLKYYANNVYILSIYEYIQK